jgi:PST family polysaccharide transporter
MLSLGFAFMAAGLATTATVYVVKVFITCELGIHATGLFEASTAISSVYVGFILAAMGADFFPQLSALSCDDTRSTQLINAQVEIGLLIATPGILAVLALGPFLLHLLYSSAFVGAFDILRWQAAGTFLRVISWPLGFLLLARGKRMLFFWSELASNLCYLGLVFFGVHRWHLPGVGVAFLGMYVFYVVLMTVLARRLVDFRWSFRIYLLAGFQLPVVAIAIVFSYVLSNTIAVIVGMILFIVVGIISIKLLHNMIGAAKFNSYVHNVLFRLHFRR